MTMVPPSQGILLVDDGELDDVARVLEAEGNPLSAPSRGPDSRRRSLHPSDLLIVTPRRVERVRRGSPAEARPGRPLRIIAVEEDSPCDAADACADPGLHLLIRQTADREIWRMLVARALYRGSERRRRPACGHRIIRCPATSKARISPASRLVDCCWSTCRTVAAASSPLRTAFDRGPD